MQPSPELRRDWEFYPGRKKGKIQDRYVGPIAISVHQGPFERADKENKLRGEGEKPTPEEGARV